MSERGKEDARQVTELFTSVKIGAVISSPYPRAVETVQGIADQKGLKVFIEKDFKERKLSGQPIADFQKAVEKTWADFDFRWPGGESNNEARRRGVQALRQIIERLDLNGQNVVVGTHGNLLAIILSFFDETYHYSFWQQLDMPDIYRARLKGNKLIEIERIWKRGRQNG